MATMAYVIMRVTPPPSPLHMARALPFAIPRSFQQGGGLSVAATTAAAVARALGAGPSAVIDAVGLGEAGDPLSDSVGGNTLGASGKWLPSMARAG